MFKSVFVFVLCISYCACASFHSSKIPLCHVGDSECMKNSTNIVLKQFYEGVPEVALASIDPLEISRMSIEQGGESPVRIEIVFNKVNLHGLRDFVVTSVSGFNVDPNGRYEMRLKGPQLIMEGSYTMKGQILVLPVQGKGHCNFTLTNPDVYVRFTGKTKQNGEKVHLYTEDLKMTFKVTRMRAYFDNLFNGDKLLGETTNRFLNENWMDIFNEIKGTSFEAFSLIAQKMLNNLFSHHDYNDLFLKD